MEDEYWNVPFQQPFVRESFRLGRWGWPGNYCPGTGTCAGCTQTCVQLTALWPDVLSHIALSAMNEEWGRRRLIDDFIFLACGFSSELKNGSILFGLNSPGGLAAGSQSLPGSQYIDGQSQQGLTPKRFGQYWVNVANNKPCSCSMYWGREPGGGFCPLAKEEVLQRKPISETLSKIPSIFSGAAAKRAERRQKTQHRADGVV